MIAKDSGIIEARFDAALDALRTRRARAAERADELACEIDRVAGTPTATVLRRRLESVVGFINKIDRMLACRGGTPP